MDGLAPSLVDDWYKLHCTIVEAVLSCYVTKSKGDASHRAERLADAIWAALTPEQVRLAVKGVQANRAAEHKAWMRAHPWGECPCEACRDRS